MAGVTGQRNTVNVAADQLGRDISEEIQMLEPNAQALAIWTSRLNKKRCVSKKVEWGEDSRKARFLSVAAGGALVGAAVIPVTAGQGTYVQQWDQLLNTRTGEQIRVDSIAGDNVTVTRGIGSMNAADELYLIGAAQPEGDTSKPARSDNPSVLYNLTQIFRTPVEASGTLLATAPLLRPHDWDHQKRKAGVEHAIDKELAFLFGRRSALTSGASEDRTMGGALSFIATNQTDAGGDLSEPEWNAFQMQAFDYGSQSKLFLASGVVLSALNKFPASKQQTRNDETTYGMSVHHFTSPFGELNVVQHKLLKGSKYGGYGILVDMDQAAYRFLAGEGENRDTKVLPNRQANDLDGRKEEILTEVTLQFGTEKAHAVLSGVTS
jgi:hypothetical protein